MIKIKPVTKPSVTPLPRSIAARGCVTPDQPTCVYRHFSSDGELLYVGASVSPIARAEEHRATSAWYRKIARIELEWFASYPEAIDAERRAIRTENPSHNTMKYGLPQQGYSSRPFRWAGGRTKVYASNADRQRAYRKRRAAERETP